MVILIAIGLFIVLVVVILVLHIRYTKVSQALFGARRDIAKLQARLSAARKAAQDFEAQCTGLMRQVSLSLESTGQALNVAGHIRVVRQQMQQLLDLVAYSDGQHAADASQPAIEDGDAYQLEPACGPRELDVPAHHHVSHADTRALPTTRAPWALHPGQRRAG